MHTYTHAISGGCSTESHWYAGDVYEFGFCLDKFIDMTVHEGALYGE